MKPDRRSSLGPVGLVIYNLFYWPYLLATVILAFFPALALYAGTFWQRPRRWLNTYTAVWGAHYLSWAPFAGVRVEGRERAFTNGPAVFVVNHQSMVDILAVYALRAPFLWVSKVENFYVPFLGWNMWLNGYVPLRRGHLPSIRRMLRDCESRLRQGASLCVFPEGTRSRDGNLRSFYRGAFWIAARYRVPVIPIVVDGTFSILKKGHFGIRPRPVTLRVLEPLLPEDFGHDDRRLRDAVYERMERELASMRSPEKAEATALARIELRSES
ncbi:MAG TPA: lysophospholipid acyltransferase family protein [Polyangiaceae bacterium]|nr:lysophospholipid acyltransferase family protein [Polyangiaceae bacterium]